MKSILETMLTGKISELKKQNIHGQKILNMIKGNPLHLIVLNFLYSHKIYKNCVMYGGSALKLMYDLPRMSVDLDFEINFPLNLERFKKETADYFKDKYGYKKLGVSTSAEDKDTIVVKITFSGLEKFKIPDLNFTKLKVRLDFNKFDTNSFQQVIVPISNEDYNFNLKTYPLSTLMASKIAALLSRVQYGVPVDSGESVLADYKGRDIYDLIWYLQRGTIPNLRYLEQKKHVYHDYPALFKKIKDRLSNLSDGGKALKEDLTHLYLQPAELDEWKDKWHELFLDSIQKNYSFIKIKGLELVRVTQNFDSDHFVFKYDFETDQNKKARFTVVVSDSYIEDFPISGHKRDDIRLHIASGINTVDENIIKEYAGLFYSKIEDFLKRINGVSPRLKIQTKLILYSGSYDPDMMVVFANKELETCQLEDLL